MGTTEREDSDRNYRELVESLGAIVWEADPNTLAMTYVGGAAEAMLGYPLQRWFEKDFWRSILHPLDRDWAVEFCVAAIALRQDHEFEYRVVAADGRIVWLKDIVRVDVDDDEIVPTVRGVMVDITDQKSALETVERLQRDHELILTTAGEGIMGLDNEGNARFVNPAAARMLGWDPEELIGRRMHDVIHHSRPDGSSYPIEECPSYAVFEDGIERLTMHDVMWRKDGTSFPVEYSTTPIYEDGELTGAVLIVRDISDRVTAENELRASQERLNTVLEQVPLSLWAVDTEGRFTLIQGRGLDAVGLKQEDLLGVSIFDYYASVSPTQGKILRGVLAGGPDGRVLAEFGGRTWDTVITALRDDTGAVVGALGASLDITERVGIERELDESQRHLKAILAQVPVSLWTVDTEGRFTLLEGRATASTGISPAEILGKSAFDLYGNDGKEGIAAIRRALGGIESLHQAEYGGRIWETICTPLRRDEEVIGALGVSVDVTQRVQAERKTTRSLSLVKATLESTTDGFLVVDLGGRIVGHNERFAQMWQIPRRILESRDDEAVIASVLEQLVDPGHFLSRVRQLYETPDMESFDVLEFKDGRVFERYSKPQRVDRLVVGRVWSFRDVTERVRAEETLRSREAQLAEAQALTHVGSWIWHYDGSVEMSDELFRILGMDPSEGASFERLMRSVHPDDRHLADEIVDSATNDQQAFEISLRVIRSDESIRLLNIQGRSEIDDEGRVQMFGSAQDITEQNLLEEQLRQAQKMEAVGQLAGGIAHDMNNLLTAILGNAELAVDGELPEDARIALEEIGSTAEAASALIGQLLDLSRRRPRRPESIDLNEVVASMESMLRRVIREDIVLISRLTLAPATVLADRSQIEQLILNLVINGRDAISGRGEIEIEVARERRDSSDPFAQMPADLSGDVVRLTVRDNGSGMDEYTKVRAFEPFFTTKDRGSGRGTGLGLAVAYGAVTQSGGTVFVESQPGSGSTFHVYLPFIRREAAQIVLPNAAPTSLIGDGGTILLVEDDSRVRLPAARSLEGAGYQVLIASGASDALAIAASYEARIDLMVTDVVMPGMGGVELATELRRTRPEIAVLYMSGHADGLTDRLAGSNRFLAKPFRPQDLVAKAGEVIRAGARVDR